MQKTRPFRIAVLFDHVESDYQLDVMSGVVRATRSARARALFVAGGWLEPSPAAPVVRNFVYELVAAAPIHGVLLLAGNLSNYVGLERFKLWAQRFSRLPCIFVGIDLPGLPSVFVDNEVGQRAVVTHLIEKHGCRRLAFLAGPQGSAECDARRRGYESALAAHGIALDPRAIVPGGLEREHGRRAVRELFDERGFSPQTLDALVAVNDESALGALDELARRRIAVPERMLVTGFDDCVSARRANPALTTIAQRVEEQAYTAARLLLAHLDAGVPLASKALEPELVVRPSCGCPPPFGNDSRAVREPKGGMARSCRLALIERRPTILAELARAAAGRLVGMPGWEGRLLDGLAQDLERESRGTFCIEVEDLVRKNVALDRDIAICHAVLTKLRFEALTCAAIEPESRPRIEDLFQEARLVMARVDVDVEREEGKRQNAHLRAVAKTCVAASATLDASALADTLDTHLPPLGIECYGVTRFEHGAGPRAELRVVARRLTGVNAAPGTLLASDLGLDAGLLLEEAMVIEPLEFAGRPVGLAALGWGAREPVHYEQLRELLSTALYVQQEGQKA